VKVVLCSKCVRKIMWKRKHEKRSSRKEDDNVEEKIEASGIVEMQEDRRPPEPSRSKDVERNDDSEPHAQRRRSSRSRSPRSHKRKQEASSSLLRTKDRSS
jgi:protein FRA10AC1